MKARVYSWLFLPLWVLLLFGSAAAERKAGPRGGKLLENEPPRAEFLIGSDRVASIAFYDSDGKLLPPEKQTVLLIAEAPAGKKKLEFERKENLLVAKEPLPEGDDYNLVIQIQKDSGAKPQNFRVKYDVQICRECNHPEYACTCEH